MVIIFRKKSRLKSRQIFSLKYDRDFLWNLASFVQKEFSILLDSLNNILGILS